MRIVLSSMLAGAALAAAGSAFAQAAPTQYPGVATDVAPRAAPAPMAPQAMTPEARAARRAQMRQMTFTRLDTNRDGQISQTEFAVAGDRMGATRGQRAGRPGMMARRQGAPSQPGMAQRLGAMVDTNRDGTVSRDEFTSAMLQRFDRQDANHDGKIAPGERRGPMGGAMRAPRAPAAAG